MLRINPLPSRQSEISVNRANLGKEAEGVTGLIGSREREPEEVLRRVLKITQRDMVKRKKKGYGLI